MPLHLSTREFVRACAAMARNRSSSSAARNVVRRPKSAAAVAARAQRAAQWERDMIDRFDVFLATYLKNPNNRKEHWRKAQKREEHVRPTIEFLCDRAGIARRMPVRVVMTRYGPQLLDEGCGLNASLKHVRDGVADYFGPADDDPGYRWVYRQKKTRLGQNGVSVEFSYPKRKKKK